MKSIVLIDGENLKGKIKDILKLKNKEITDWSKYDFDKLFKNIFKNKDLSDKIFYFARIKEHKESLEKSKELIKQQRLLKTKLEKDGFKVIMSGVVRGNYKEDEKGKRVLVFKEKGVDVKIAVDIVSLSCDKKVDEIILVSSDSDMQPAIKEGKNRNMKFIYVGFESGQNRGLIYTADKTILLRDEEVFDCC